HRRIPDRGRARARRARRARCVPRRGRRRARTRRPPRGAPAPRRRAPAGARMMALRQLPRLWRIARIAARHRLDDLLPATHRPAWLGLLRVFGRPDARTAALPRGERLVLALTALGPIFVKAGQILSTRRDLLPADVADALTQLQDRVAPYPAGQARAAIEAALGAPLDRLFASFDDVP